MNITQPSENASALSGRSEPGPTANPAEPASTVPTAAATVPNPLFAGGVWLVILGALLLLCGMCAAFSYVVFPLVSKAPGGLSTNILFGGTAGFALLFGAVLAWQGWITARGTPPPAAAQVFPPVVVLVLVFIGAVLLGIATLALTSVAPFVFPPWHFIAASVPPLALLAFGAHRLGKTSGLRALVLSFGWGAMAATTLAFLLELIVAVVFIVIAALVIASLPNSGALVEQMQAQLRLAQQTQDFTQVARWFSNPPVALAFILYFAIIVPPLEEAVKAFIVAFIDPRRTQASDALLWGMAAGAGFALVENIFNASAAPAAWAQLIVLRVGAAIVHVTNGANLGRGWYAARVERRWGTLFLFYVASVVYHAVWNATAIGLSNGVFNLTAETFTLNPPTLVALAGLLVLVALAGLGLLWLVNLVQRTARLVSTA